ncbi:MAG: phosphatase PAP2 family protein [Mycobacterium sp.]|nr:phosphatase PAP2 family protein [Mycobacterium sp.]
MTRSRTVVLLAVAATTVYAAMWVGYCRHWSWLRGVDWWLLDAARDAAVKHPMWVRFWDGVSFALGPVPLRLLGAVAAVAALVRRNVRAALLLLACAPLNGAVTAVAKGLADRPRPPTMLVPTSAPSFPSGHALEATATLLALLTVLLPLVSRPVRRVAAAVATSGVLLVGAARVALNVHYPSDVLAGWSLGYLYFALCLLVFRPSMSDAGGGVTAR